MGAVAVFVDAGYFWVQATCVVHGDRRERDSVVIDYAALRHQLLLDVARQFAGTRLLRVYWYDGPGANGGKTAAHSAIDDLDDFKLRLGTRNGHGAQKAVDGLIIADLIGLAQSKAIEAAIVLSGDADLTPGVIAAQGLGLRVHLLSMGPSASTSPFLRHEVDCKVHWSDEAVRTFARATTTTIKVPVDSVAAAAPPHDPLNAIAAQVLAAAQQQGFVLPSGNAPLPKAVDGRLLTAAKHALARPLREEEKRALRAAFRTLAATHQSERPPV